MRRRVRPVPAPGPWTLEIPLEEGMDVLRLHALVGGSAEEGYDIGTVTFLTAEGEDVSAASVPLSDVVHGVPRARGSAVDD